MEEMSAGVDERDDDDIEKSVIGESEKEKRRKQKQRQKRKLHNQTTLSYTDRVVDFFLQKSKIGKNR